MQKASAQSKPQVQYVFKWKETPVLTAHGYSLYEDYNGRGYNYRAVNNKTGESVHICHRDNRVPKIEYLGLIPKPKLPVQAKASNKRKSSVKRKSSERRMPIAIEPQSCPTVIKPSERGLCVDVISNEKITRELFDKALSQIFKKYLPKYGYSLRFGQIELALHIGDSLYCRKISMSEAGVGIGKTHAYLIAAAIAKRGRVNDFWLKGNYPGMPYITEMPVVVATSSIALRKAIIKDYIPEISKILIKHGIIKKPLTGVIRKGKEHYICGKRLLSLLRQSERAEVKKSIAPLIYGENGIDLDDMDFLDAYTKRRINVTGQCGKKCEMFDTCPYMAFLRDAQSDKYDFQVCNHNYLLADIKHRAKDLKPLIPNYQAIIIDEAHKLLDNARQMYGFGLSNMDLPQLIDDVRSFTFRQGQDTAELDEPIKWLEYYASRLFKALVKNIPKENYDDDAERFMTVIDVEINRYLRNIRVCLAELAGVLENLAVTTKHESLYSYTKRKLADIREIMEDYKSHDNLIYWLEKPDGFVSLDAFDGGEIQLRAIPKNLDEMLRADLWSNGIPIVLTSGTLSASGDFTHAKLGLGLNKFNKNDILETCKASPYDYKKNVLIYTSDKVLFPNQKNQEYITSVADEVERLILASHGHAMALFTSYRVMELVFDTFEKRGLPFPLFKLKRSEVGVVDRFRKSGNGVMFATGSMWEGVDLPGDILSMLIIVKLPFSVPDPISEHERKQFGSMESYINAVVIPKMQVKLKQGFGRLIRSETDTGVVALLDFRVRVGGLYRDCTLTGLPDCRVTDDIGVVEDFYVCKPPEYFDKAS